MRGLFVCRNERTALIIHVLITRANAFRHAVATLEYYRAATRENQADESVALEGAQAHKLGYSLPTSSGVKRPSYFCCVAFSTKLYGMRSLAPRYVPSTPRALCSTHGLRGSFTPPLVLHAFRCSCPSFLLCGPLRGLTRLSVSLMGK